MALKIFRILFIFFTTAIGGTIAAFADQPAVWGALIGLAIGSGIMALEMSFKKFSLRGFSAGIIGLVLGVVAAYLFKTILGMLPPGFFSDTDEVNDRVINYITGIGALIFIYFGIVIGIKSSDKFSLLLPYAQPGKEEKLQKRIIVDTSVIIDGRISDIAETGFIEDQLIIPRFVLRELQTIADSADPLKRARGRRGLDILNKIQKDPHIDVKIHEPDLPEVDDVDAKIVKLAKMLDAKIFTNDYNLNKVAEFQQVKVLNINDLANALKPVILPGETMTIRIVREGKEIGQGVAYLDDGTMVVVNNGKDKIGQKLEVAVTSVLQTSAGRMIFADIKDTA